MVRTITVGDMDIRRLRPVRHITFHEAYTKLIFPFRGLLKKLLIHVGQWGNMLTISYNGGLVRGHQWFVPENVLKNMIPVADFTIYIDADSNETVFLNHLFSTRPFETPDQLRNLVFSRFRPSKLDPTAVFFAFRQGLPQLTGTMM